MLPCRVSTMVSRILALLPFRARPSGTLAPHPHSSSQTAAQACIRDSGSAPTGVPNLSLPELWSLQGLCHPIPRCIFNTAGEPLVSSSFPLCPLTVPYFLLLLSSLLIVTPFPAFSTYDIFSAIDRCSIIQHRLVPPLF